MITGISAISGEQLIAAGAISAKEAATAAFTTGGNDIQDLYDTVSTNSGSWTGGGAATLPVSGSAGENTAVYDLYDMKIEYNLPSIGGSEPEHTYVQAGTNSITVYESYDEDQSNVQTVVGPGYVHFENPEDGSVDFYPSDVSNWVSVYNTVSTESGNWTGGGGGADPFPAEIKTGSTLVGVVTTGFQDNTATRPTLFISGTTATNNYPRMLLSENHAAAQTSKSGAFLADAFEFYTGKNGGSTKILRIDTANVSGTYFWLNKNEVHGATGNTAYYVGGTGASGKAAADKGWSITISGISGQSANGAGDTWKMGAEEYEKWNSAYDQLGNVTALLNSI